MKLQSKLVQKEVKCLLREALQSSDNIDSMFKPDDAGNRLLIFEKLKVGIVGIGSGAGVSFTSTCIAKACKEKGKLPCVIELGKASIYDSIGMDKRFYGREYFKFYEAILNDKSIRNNKNISEGINWIVKDTSERNFELSSSAALRLVNNAIGEVIICDFSGLEFDNHGIMLKELLLDMDFIIVVINPLPSKLLPGLSKIEEIKKLIPKQIYVINKSNSGVNRNELLKFIKINKPIYFPHLSAELIYEAEYTCIIPYAMEKAKQNLAHPLGEIVDIILKKEKSNNLRKS